MYLEPSPHHRSPSPQVNDTPEGFVQVGPGWRALAFAPPALLDFAAVVAISHPIPPGELASDGVSLPAHLMYEQREMQWQAQLAARRAATEAVEVQSTLAIYTLCQKSLASCVADVVMTGFFM